jgi:hypothetical protein
MTNDGPLELPDPMVRAIIRSSEFQADLVAAVIEASELFKSKLIQVSAACLLEFAALLQIWFWDHQGLRPQLPADLPTYQEAAASFAARAAKGDAGFEGANASLLGLKVIQVVMDQFAWEGQDYLQADVVLRTIDEDQLIEAIADLLWNKRHQLSAALSAPGVSHETN